MTEGWTPIIQLKCKIVNNVLEAVNNLITGFFCHFIID